LVVSNTIRTMPGFGSDSAVRLLTLASVSYSFGGTRKPSWRSPLWSCAMPSEESANNLKTIFWIFGAPRK